LLIVLCIRESEVKAELLRSVVLLTLRGALFDSEITTTWLFAGIRDKLGNSTLSWLFCFVERFDIFDYARLPDLKSVTRLRLRVSLNFRPFFEKSSNKSDFYLSPFAFSYSKGTIVVWSAWDFGVGTRGGLVAGGKREVIEGTLFTSI
jgi:hypothetical protein